MEGTSAPAYPRCTARVVEQRDDGALIVEVPAGDAFGLEVGVEVEVRRSCRTDHEWPDPFGRLAGELPDLTADDIKLARRAALAGERRL